MLGQCRLFAICSIRGKVGGLPSTERNCSINTLLTFLIAVKEQPWIYPYTPALVAGSQKDLACE